jgi:hypothetical protein
VYYTLTCWPNDFSAGIEMGGLVPRKSTSIRMESEKLFISEYKIKIHYHFFNDEAKDITTTVAFPLPEICDGEDSGDGPDLSIQNPVGLEVKSAGKGVTTQLERLIRTDPKTGNKCKKLTYYWEQLFPAKKSIELTQEYRPIPEAQIGFRFPAAGESEEAIQSRVEYEKYRGKFCIDEALHKRLSKEKAKNAKSGSVIQKSLQYILTTANSWKGPIEKFDLTIEKSKETDLISLCWDGLKKTGTKQFSSKKTNFHPDQELNILFLTLR